ncbi:conserved hypothetical protein [Ricinus communis]|uniref:Oligopeptide transporter n=1 Tax=Ricinus communis TaxID=3988 RepID=B9S9X1_RICCO|nr:conserved hypothetical protein [Ricinus communis]
MGLNVITELIIGYMYPGKPLANVAFKTYGYISMSQALSFIQDFKLGHYMKVPPKAMFFVQLVGTVVASTVYFGTTWQLSTTYASLICYLKEVHGHALVTTSFTMLQSYGESLPPAECLETWEFIQWKNKGWWSRHNYILSAALGAGIAFMGIIIFFALQSKDIYGPDWWGLDSGDHCPLAKCPTQPGILVKGCPIIQ